MDSHGNAVVAGYRLSVVKSGNTTTWAYRPFAAKVDPDGNLLWNRGYTSINATHQFAFGVAVDQEDRIVIAGYALKQLSRYEYRYLPLVMRIAPDGTPLLARLLPSATHEVAWEPAVEPDGDILLAGSVYGGFGSDVAVTRLAPDGTVLRRATVDVGTYDSAGGIALDGAGNVVVVGTDWGSYRVLAARLRPDLALDWATSFQAGFYSSGADVAVDGLGLIALAGWTYTGQGLDILAAKLLPTGGVLFARAVDAGPYEYAGGVAVTPFGGEVITGGTSYTYASGAQATLTRGLGASALGLLGAAAALETGEPVLPAPPVAVPPLP